MTNYYVRARVRGKIDYNKAVALDDYFGEHIHGYQFVDENDVPRGKIYKIGEIHISGQWEGK